VSAVDVFMAVDGGHGHVLSFGAGIGPLVLRVTLLVAVLVVSSFSFLRGFLTEPGRITTLGVIGAAGAGVVMELLLSGGLNLPEQVVPLLLAALALPMYLLLSTDQRFAPMVARLRRLAPWVFALTGSLALVEFARAWFGRAAQATATTSLHTGVVVALLALAWYAIVRTPRRRAVSLGGAAAAAGLAVVVLACAANVAVLNKQEPVQAATAAKATLAPVTTE
jgi:hypothetical protein